MIVKYTEEDKQRLADIESHYRELIQEQMDIMMALRDEMEPPEVQSYLDDARQPQPISYDVFGRPQFDPKEWSDFSDRQRGVRKKISDAYKRWEASGSDEWQAARAKVNDLRREQTEAYQRFEKECGDKQFKALGDDPKAIINDALEQIAMLIKNRYEQINQKSPYSLSMIFARYNDGKLFVDEADLMDFRKRFLPLHYGFFKNNNELLSELDNVIVSEIHSSPMTSSEGMRYSDNDLVPAAKTPSFETKFPADWVTPKDKVSNQLFSNLLPKKNPDGSTAYRVNTASSGADPWNTYIIVTDDKSNPDDPLKDLTEFEKVVYDAVVTRYETSPFMTDQMIYAAMIKDPDARVTDEMRKNINKAMIAASKRVKIKISDGEAKAYNMASLEFEGQLLHWDRMKGVYLNGAKVDGYIIYRQPLLRTLADKKKQIGRVKMKLIRTNKLRMTSETIVVQHFILNQVLAMKGNPDYPRIIKKDKILQRADLSSLASDAAKYNKKSRILKFVRSTLEQWATPKRPDFEAPFIAGFREDMDSFKITFDKKTAEVWKKERDSNKAKQKA